MAEAPVAVLGAGGHAKVVIATLEANGVPIAGLYDDDTELHGTAVLGVEVLGPLAMAADRQPERAIVAIGNNRTRSQVAALFLPDAIEWVTAVHPAAFVHPSVRIGPGTVVFAGAVIQPGVVMGSHVIINTGATVDHDCRLGDYVHIAPGVHLAGEVEVGEGTLMGIGSVAIPTTSVGSWVVVGAGGAVVDDIAGHSTVVGVPARSVESRS